jgi:hypothetical protein
VTIKETIDVKVLYNILFGELTQGLNTSSQHNAPASAQQNLQWHGRSIGSNPMRWKKNTEAEAEAE